MKRMRGFTLIELMVSLTLGMIVLGAVVAVYVNSKRTFNVVSQRISMQQDARIALLQISRDLRMAGSYGCATLDACGHARVVHGCQFLHSFSVPGPGLGGHHATLGLQCGEALETGQVDFLDLSTSCCDCSFGRLSGRRVADAKSPQGLTGSAEVVSDCHF